MMVMFVKAINMYLFSVQIMHGENDIYCKCAMYGIQIFHPTSLWEGGGRGGRTSIAKQVNT